MVYIANCAMSGSVHSLPARGASRPWCSPCPDYFLHAEGKNSLGTRLALVRLDTRGVFNWIVECSTHIRRGGITK